MENYLKIVRIYLNFMFLINWKKIFMSVMSERVNVKRVI